MQEFESIPGSMTLTVRKMALESTGVVSVELSAGDSGALPNWRCGAHVDLILRRDLIRQYSLCGAPGDPNVWKIAVLREPISRGASAYVHESLRVGDQVGVVGPRNNFKLEDAEQYLFVAGGIGITPLIPMVHAVSAAGCEWALLYGGRLRSSMAFLEELARYGDRVMVRPEDEFGLLDLVSAIEPLRDGALVYCCGPDPLIAAVEKTCEALARFAPRFERFGAPPGDPAVVDGASEAFELVLAGSGQRFVVPPDRTIIEVLGGEGVFVPTSCTEGYCGVCETEVIAGLPDHRDTFLDPDVRATNGRMMICCGRSKSPELVLNI